MAPQRPLRTGAARDWRTSPPAPNPLPASIESVMNLNRSVGHQTVNAAGMTTAGGSVSARGVIQPETNFIVGRQRRVETRVQWPTTGPVKPTPVLRHSHVCKGGIPELRSAGVPIRLAGPRFGMHPWGSSRSSNGASFARRGRPRSVAISPQAIVLDSPSLMSRNAVDLRGTKMPRQDPLARVAWSTSDTHRPAPASQRQ